MANVTQKTKARPDKVPRRRAASPPPMQVGITVNSRHSDTVRTLHALKRAGVNMNVHVITQDWQARRATGLDAVLIGGGADIHPNLYGERNWGARMVDHRRDRLEVILAEACLGAGVPLMGICRGGQLINAVLGGTLHQDLWEDLGIEHDPEHALDLAPELDRLFPVPVVNSSHHQGVKDVGDDLEVLAVADDGIPELLWRPGVLACQFHPETLAVEDARWLNLFKWWLDGARMVPQSAAH